MTVEEKCSSAKTLLIELPGLKSTIFIFTDKITSLIEKLYMVVRGVYRIVSNMIWWSSILVEGFYICNFIIDLNKILNTPFAVIQINPF